MEVRNPGDSGQSSREVRLELVAGPDARGWQSS